jgi:pyridoxal phosphate enzyme (YggS family)
LEEIFCNRNIGYQIPGGGHSGNEKFAVLNFVAQLRDPNPIISRFNIGNITEFFIFDLYESLFSQHRIFTMPVDQIAYKRIATALALKHVQLVAVSKTKPVTDILELYDLGQRDFGENYVQELLEKHLLLPHDIRWHFIGHLQSNKVKYLAPFIHLIHGVDTFKLLTEINRQAAKNHRVIQCLLQVHIAQEESKFGLDQRELEELFQDLTKATEIGELRNIKVIGLMGMASFSEDVNKVRLEFKYLKMLFDQYASIKSVNVHLTTLSMGMSNDYKLAIDEGGNMVRIGSLLFGAREKAG